MTMLSEHFSLSEFVLSQTAIRRGIDNTPSPEVIENLRELCVVVLEPLRAIVGPLRISSGYRSIYLNQAIGGAKTSQHVRGEAADIISHKYSVEELFQIIKKSGLQIDQGIFEFGEWNHVSHVKGKNRGEFLRATHDADGHTVYAHD